jgi:hypothetical protein
MDQDVTAMVTERAEIDSLKSDRDFGKLLLTKVDYGAVAPPEVAAAKARWADLHKKAFPQITEVRSAADVVAQAQQRNAQVWDEYIAGVRQKLDLTADEEAEIRGGVISKDIYQRAVAEKDRCVREKGFLQRLRDNDPDVAHRWNTLLQILSLRPV